jgi:hypothetical protein
MSTLLQCDRCGATAPFSYGGQMTDWRFLRIDKEKDDGYGAETDYRLDLCPKCSSDLAQWRKGGRDDAR